MGKVKFDKILLIIYFFIIIIVSMFFVPFRVDENFNTIHSNLFHECYCTLDYLRLTLYLLIPGLLLLIISKLCK